MNKTIIAGILLLVGGFMLGGAVGGDLIAKIGGERDSRPSRPPSLPRGKPGDVAACQDAFRTAEDQYHVAVKTAQDAFAKAREARNACMKVRKEASPKPTPISTLRAQ